MQNPLEQFNTETIVTYDYLHHAYTCVFVNTVVNIAKFGELGRNAHWRRFWYGEQDDKHCTFLQNTCDYKQCWHTIIKFGQNRQAAKLKLPPNV